MGGLPIPQDIGDRILDMWAAQTPTEDIRRALGFQHKKQVSDYVEVRRKRGDPRAVRRHSVKVRVVHLQPDKPESAPPPEADRSRLCPELGIEVVTKMVPRLCQFSSGIAGYMPVSLPRLRCLEDAA